MGAADSGPVTRGLMCSVAPESSTVLEVSSTAAVTRAWLVVSTRSTYSTRAVPGMVRQSRSGIGECPTLSTKVNLPGTGTDTCIGRVLAGDGAPTETLGQPSR